MISESFFSTSDKKPPKQMKLIIQGGKNIEQNEKIYAIVQQANIGKSFFNYNVELVKNDIKKAFPSIENVLVKKIWPNTVQIKLIERIPIGIWNNIDFIDKFGYIFTNKTLKKNKLSNLIHFYGSAGTEKKVIEHYNNFQTIIDNNVHIINSVSLDEHDYWRIVLDNKIEIMLGKKQIKENLAQFINLYSDIIKPEMLKKEMIYVDLRYRSGIALKSQ